MNFPGGRRTSRNCGWTTCNYKKRLPVNEHAGYQAHKVKLNAGHYHLFFLSNWRITALVAGRKYRQGHRVPERWVFGGIDPESKIGFLVLVDDRSSNTLLPLIQRSIAPGSIVYSDQWTAYNGIRHLNVSPAFQHFAVNHQLNFVDPNTGCTTHYIEGI